MHLDRYGSLRDVAINMRIVIKYMMLYNGQNIAVSMPKYQAFCITGQERSVFWHGATVQSVCHYKYGTGRKKCFVMTCISLTSSSQEDQVHLSSNSSFGFWTTSTRECCRHCYLDKQLLKSFRIILLYFTSMP